VSGLLIAAESYMASSITLTEMIFPSFVLFAP